MIAPATPPRNVVPCKNWHLTYLCERMRPDEQEQYVALSFAAHYDPEIAAASFIALAGVKFTVIGEDGMPVAAGGYHEIQPGIWHSWMVGSMEGWRTHRRTMRQRKVRAVMPTPRAQPASLHSGKHHQGACNGMDSVGLVRHRRQRAGPGHPQRNRGLSARPATARNCRRVPTRGTTRAATGAVHDPPQKYRERPRVRLECPMRH